MAGTRNYVTVTSQNANSSVYLSDANVDDGGIVGRFILPASHVVELNSSSQASISTDDAPLYGKSGALLHGKSGMPIFGRATIRKGGTGSGTGGGNPTDPDNPPVYKEYNVYVSWSGHAYWSDGSQASSGGGTDEYTRSVTLPGRSSGIRAGFSSSVGNVEVTATIRISTGGEVVYSRVVNYTVREVDECWLYFDVDKNGNVIGIWQNGVGYL